MTRHNARATCPKIDAVVNWRLLAPSALSGFPLPFFCQSVLEQLFRPLPQEFLFTLAVAERRRAATSRHPPHVLSLKLLSELWSQARLSPKEFPRFFLSVLETLFYLRAFSPAVSLSSKVLKLHACELGRIRASSLPVALTNKLTTSSANATAS